MRAFAQFFGLILAGLIAMAVLSYPAWALLTPQLDFPFHRVASRIGMLVLLVGFVLLARRQQLANRVSLGYGVPKPQFVRELIVAFALGVLLMLPVVVVMTLLDLRQWREGFDPTLASFAQLILKGLLSGLAVAFIEETFLRGAMFTAIARQSGARLAVFLTALIYAAVHFIARYRIPAEDVTWSSGFTMLAGSLGSFADPLSIADAFLCLFAVGLVLGAVRAVTGNIAACIGLHAGWVLIITLMRESSTKDPNADWSVLLSRFDGFIGWLVLAWTVMIGAWIIGFYRRRARVGHASHKLLFS